MVVSSPRNLLFSVIIFLALFQNGATADQVIYLNLSPSEAYVDETTTFIVEFTSTRNLSNVVMHFYVDAEKKGAKDLYNIKKNEKYFINFDYFFNKNSHLGEHYIELKIDFVAENQENESQNFYTVVDVHGEPSAIILYFFVISFFIVLIGSIVDSKLRNKSIIEFKPNERKTLFNCLVTILPISISIFTLYLTAKPELKIGMFFILLSFITSFILALYLFIIAENVSDAKANNFTIYSLLFIFLGLIQMVMLVLAF